MLHASGYLDQVLKPNHIRRPIMAKKKAKKKVKKLKKAIKTTRSKISKQRSKLKKLKKKLKKA